METKLNKPCQIKLCTKNNEVTCKLYLKGRKGPRVRNTGSVASQRQTDKFTGETRLHSQPKLPPVRTRASWHYSKLF